MLLRRVTQLGDVPVVITIDTNSDIENMANLQQQIVAGHWIDVGAHHYQCRGLQPEATHKTYDLKWDTKEVSPGKTRIDIILANRPAFAMITDFRQTYGLGCDSHAMLELD